MPILREKQNDPTDEPGIIDLEKLLKNPLLLIVLTNDDRFLSGDTLNATYTAKVTDQPDVVVTVSGIVEADEFGQNKPCVLQVANAQVITGSEVTATYQLFRNGTLLGSSREASARVIGEGLPDLKPPRLQKSVNGVLDPLDAANLQGANGQVEVLGYRKGDTVQLIVEGAPGAGSPTFTPRPLNANSRANFPLDKAFIAANMGKQVKLSYLLIRNDKPLPLSSILTASVGTIPDGHPSLPTPAIDGAVGTELDVTQLQAADQLRVGEWPHQVAGQNVWLRYDGFDTNGGAIFYEDRKGEPHNTLPGLISPVPIAWLKTLKDGSELTVRFSVNFDGALNAQTATKFPNKLYRVKAVELASGFENWESEPDIRFRLHTPVKFKSGLTFTMLEGGFSEPLYLSISADWSGTRLMLFTSRSKGRFSLPGVATHVELTNMNLDQTGNIISFFNEHGLLIHALSLPLSPGLNSPKFTYRSPEAAYISYFEIASYGEQGQGSRDAGFTVDNIKWGIGE